MALTAETIGQAAKYDQQLLVPVRPVVRRGVAAKQYETGKLLVGVIKPQVLSGKFAEEQLDTLLQLCDGTRNHSDIAQAMEISEEAVFKAVAFLWTCGLLEDEKAALDVTSGNSEMVTMLSRLGDATGVNPHWSHAIKAWQTTTVCIVGSQKLSDKFSRILNESGVQVSESIDDPAVHLIIALVTSENDDDLLAVSTIAWDRGLPLIRIAITQQRLEVGPYVDPSFTPCLNCAIASRTSSFDASSEGTDEANIHLALGIGAHQIIGLVSRSYASYLPNDTCVIDLETLENTSYASATRAGCPTCGSANGAIAPEPTLAARYEQSVAIPPRQFVDMKGHQAHYKPSNLELQHQFRNFPSAEPVEIPTPNPELMGAEHGLTAETLSLVLYYSAGLRPQDPSSAGKLRRWTAAGGNIGSVGVRVVISDPTILPAGTYAYIESDHSFKRLNTEVPIADSPVTLVFFGNVYKVAQKYGSFALRVCLQDAGCSVTTARLVCQDVGIPWYPVARWDEQKLCAACDATPEREPVTAVIQLGGTNAD